MISRLVLVSSTYLFNHYGAKWQKKKRTKYFAFIILLAYNLLYDSDPIIARSNLRRMIQEEFGKDLTSEA